MTARKSGASEEMSEQVKAELEGAETAAEEAKAADEAAKKADEAAKGDKSVAEMAVEAGAEVGEDGKTAVTFYNPAPKARRGAVEISDSETRRQAAKKADEKKDSSEA